MSATETSETIDALLKQFVAEPFLNLREHDFQAELFARLRIKFPANVSVTFLMNPKRSRPHQWIAPQTSRVHREPAIGSKRPGAGGWVEPDVVILHDAPVTLTCHAHGAMAAQKAIAIEQVEVAIELKNTPSKNSKEVKLWLKDVAKLMTLQKQRPAVSCFAVFFDQSISTSSARSAKDMTEDWISKLPGAVHVDRPNPPFIEVCFVDPIEHVPRRRFVTEA